MIQAAVYDTRPYDRDYLVRASAGREITWSFNEFRLSADTAISAKGAKVVCVFVNDVVNHECLELLQVAGVQLIALRCTGFNNVDHVAAHELGISVTRVPTYSPYAVAEHAVAILQTLNRKIHRAFNRVRELNFALAGLIGFDLHGKTAGVVGTGRIGRIVAEIFRGFGMDVIAYDPMPDADWAAEHHIGYVSFHDLLHKADVVSLHVPLTPQTRNLINDETLAMMKPNAYLVNVSRGKLIETAALIDALKFGRLGGVALDVYEEEEGVFFEDLSSKVLQDDELARLLTFPNVLITSHQAFFTKEALTDIANVTVENITRLATGKPFVHGTAL